MNEYTLEIPPEADLQQIGNVVRGEEAGASRFQQSAIAFYEGRITNLAVFEELAPGAIPEDILFLPGDASEPDGHSLCWQGVMIVAAVNTAVKAFRKSSAR